MTPDGGPAGGAPALVFRDVGKCLGGTWVVEHLDLTVPRGSILGLIGPSGSGKTTTIRLANGVYRPDAGEVALLGDHPSALPARRRTRLGYLPQTPVLFEDLSLLENLNFHASLNGVRLRRRRRLDELLDLVDLRGHERKLVREASGGMRRRLALAAAMVHDPEVLMLDEPTAGIDPILRTRLWERFRSLADDGRTLVVTTQYVGEAANCETIGLLDGGRIIALGEPERLRYEAAGGDVVHVGVDRPIAPDEIATVAGEVGATAWRQTGAHEAEFVVVDGGAAIPPIVDALAARAMRPEDIGEVTMSYDDMFVALVERSQAERAAVPAGAGSAAVPAGADSAAVPAGDDGA